MIQYFPKHSSNSEDHKRRKGRKINRTCNVLNKNTDITQVAIIEFQTSQPNGNIIPYQVQMSSM